MKQRLGLALVLIGLALLAYLTHIAFAIEKQSTVDDVEPARGVKADAIVVLGAAEYRGKPSPVLEARLNHALLLFLRGDAPRIITTGGAGGDPVFTEGSVGRAYLTAKGVPPENISVEREGESTVQSVAAVAEIMHSMGLKSAIVVSDGYHIFRVKKMFQARGVRVYGSPRPSAPVSGWRAWWLYFRQAAGYLLWRIGIPI